VLCLWGRVGQSRLLQLVAKSGDREGLKVLLNSGSTELIKSLLEIQRLQGGSGDEGPTVVLEATSVAEFVELIRALREAKGALGEGFPRFRWACYLGGPWGQTPSSLKLIEEVGVDQVFGDDISDLALLDFLRMGMNQNQRDSGLRAFDILAQSSAFEFEVALRDDSDSAQCLSGMPARFLDCFEKTLILSVVPLRVRKGQSVSLIIRHMGLAKSARNMVIMSGEIREIEVWSGQDVIIEVEADSLLSSSLSPFFRDVAQRQGAAIAFLEAAKGV
jgi:hypothetical protein